LVDAKVLENLEGFAICSNFCRQVRLHRALNPEFAYLYLQHLYAAGELDRFQPQTVNIRNLNVPDFMSEVVLPVPPRAEQDRICAAVAESLNTLRRASSVIEKTAAFRGSRLNIAELQRSIISSAVTGRLVPGEAALAEAEARDYESGDALVLQMVESKQAA